MSRGRVSLGSWCDNRLRAALRVTPRHAAFGALLILAGCGGSALDTYGLSAPRDGLAGRSSSRQMAVIEPVATSPYDSERIVVRTGPEAVAYLKGAQWVDRLPRLVQTMMIQSFENARLLRSVGRPGERFVADTSLTSEIRRFEIDVTTNEAVVELSARVVAEGSGRIVAARIFTAREPGSAADGKAASAALDQAFDRVLREMVAWSSGR